MITRPTTVVLVDNHEMVLTGIAARLAAADPPIEVVAAEGSVAAAWTSPGSTADVVVLDLQLNDNVGPDFANLRRLVDAGRNVVVYTGFGTRGNDVHCINLGALSFVLKSEGTDHLVYAINEAAQSRPYTPPTLSGSIAADNDPNRPKLTDREIEALRAWFQSSSKELAAARMCVRPRTVDSYIERVRVKYAAAGRPAPTKHTLVRRAIEDGLFTWDELHEGGDSY